MGVPPPGFMCMCIYPKISPGVYVSPAFLGLTVVHGRYGTTMIGWEKKILKLEALLQDIFPLQDAKLLAFQLFKTPKITALKSKDLGRLSIPYKRVRGFPKERKPVIFS